MGQNADFAHVSSPAARAFGLARSGLISAFLAGDTGNFVARMADLADDYFVRALSDLPESLSERLSAHPFALVAVGGYGRRELCLGSDIDILLVFAGDVPAQEANELAQAVFYPLWDLGLEVGHGVRSIADCRDLSCQDFEVLASLLDARIVAGDALVSAKLGAVMADKVFCLHKNEFASWLGLRNAKRLERFGDAGAMLQPNLKEGFGGLRDYHQILWLARLHFRSRSLMDLERAGVLSHGERHSLENHVHFLFDVRNHLHDISRRKNDHLLFEFQEAVAARMGYAEKPRRDLSGPLAVEKFLAGLQGRMNDIKVLHRFIWSHYFQPRPQPVPPPQRLTPALIAADGELNFIASEAILERPDCLLDIFEQSAITGFPLSWEARRLVREFLHLLAPIRDLPASVETYLRILTSARAFFALEQMLETGALGELVPEFGRIQDLVQFDAYHIYPVGRHTIKVLDYLTSDALKAEGGFTEVIAGVADFRRLALAAFFHDIGKGSGQDHSRRGVEIARTVLERWAIESEAAQDVLDLIEHHLLLAKNATRLDLADETVIIRTASALGSTDRLLMLYALTWADSNASGPKAWTGWIASLTGELYLKCRKILTTGDLAKSGASRHRECVLAEVREQAPGVFDDTPRFASRMEALIAAMPPRYIQMHDADEIVRHLRLVRKYEEELDESQRRLTWGRGGAGVVVMDARRAPHSRVYEITLVTRDAPGVFATFTGVLSLHDLNILSADIFVWGDGHVVDVFKVAAPQDDQFIDELWERVLRAMKYALTGKLALEYRLAEKRTRPGMKPSVPQGRPLRVNIDTAASDFYTLIEVVADDRIGLLHDIALAMQNMQLDIHVARISTHGDQAADVFYVRDVTGLKIVDRAHLEEIRRAMIFMLSKS